MTEKESPKNDKLSDDISSGVSRITKQYAKDMGKSMNNKMKTKQNKVKKYRKEASRLASMANKRVARLQTAGLTDSPAYQRHVENGSIRFGVAGKDHNQLQAEVARMNNFIKSDTSTIRGVNKVLREMAKNTGIRYSKLSDLREKAGQFFELASKVAQYLDTVDDMATAIGYQAIWEAVNTYVKQEKIDLSDSTNDIDKMVDRVTKALKTYHEPMGLHEFGVKGWFTLPKD